MTDGERRCSCNVHVYLFYEPRKKTAIGMVLPSSARLSCGKDQPMCLTSLDESRAWVLTEVALLRIYNICVQQPASEAILRRSARSIPLFRADFLPFISKIVEHSRNLLPTHQELVVNGGNVAMEPKRTIHFLHIAPLVHR